MKYNCEYTQNANMFICKHCGQILFAPTEQECPKSYTERTRSERQAKRPQSQVNATTAVRPATICKAKTQPIPILDFVKKHWKEERATWGLIEARLEHCRQCENFCLESGESCKFQKGCTARTTFALTLSSPYFAEENGRCGMFPTELRGDPARAIKRAEKAAKTTSSEIIPAP